MRLRYCNSKTNNIHNFTHNIYKFVTICNQLRCLYYTVKGTRNVVLSYSHWYASVSKSIQYRVEAFFIGKCETSAHLFKGFLFDTFSFLCIPLTSSFKNFVVAHKRVLLCIYWTLRQIFQACKYRFDRKKKLKKNVWNINSIHICTHTF